MTNRQRNGVSNSQFKKAKAGQMKEEISMELAELGNMAPKQEKMTPDQRDIRERDKWYG